MAKLTEKEKKARAKARQSKKKGKQIAELVPIPGFPGAYTTKKGKVTPKDGKIWGMTPGQLKEIKSGFQDKWKI